jgi:hypothetical protein
MSEPQSYATHRHRATLWLVTALLSIAAFALILLFALRAPSVISIALVLLALTAMCLVAIVRRYALRLQDRIIRLEMQVRLAALGRQSDLTRLAIAQIVALRFASDTELPALLDRALTESLTPDQIKRSVKEWQADLMRT